MSQDDAAQPLEILAGFGQRFLGAIVDIIMFAVLFLIFGTLLTPVIGSNSSGTYFILALAVGSDTSLHFGLRLGLLLARCWLGSG